MDNASANPMKDARGILSDTAQTSGSAEVDGRSLNLALPADKVGGWTVKGVSPEDRALMNAAAQRANMMLGPWLVETARLRVANERIARLPNTPAPGMSLAELIALVRELPALSSAKNCGRLAAKLRRMVSVELEARHPSPVLAHGHGRRGEPALRTAALAGPADSRSESREPSGNGRAHR